MFPVILQNVCDFFHGHVYRNQWSWVQNKSPRMASLRIFPETVLVYTFTLLQVVEHKTLFDWIQGLIAVSNYRYTEKANDNKLVLNPPRVGEEWIVNPWLARMLKVQHHYYLFLMQPVCERQVSTPMSEAPSAAMSRTGPPKSPRCCQPVNKPSFSNLYLNMNIGTQRIS